MKTQFKLLKKLSWLAFAAFLFTVYSGNGCATKTPDPLAGWQFSSLDNLNSNKAIKDDYEQYVQKLSKTQRNSCSPIIFLQDGKGQHAIKFFTALNGTYTTHILIYNQNNIRVSVLRYTGGHYAS